MKRIFSAIIAIALAMFVSATAQDAMLINSIDESSAVQEAAGSETNATMDVQAASKSYNRWMLGARAVWMPENHAGAGVEAIFGRQFSKIVFLGVGFGADVHITQRGAEYFVDSLDPDDEWDGGPVFSIPIFADLQVNFGKYEAPFFAELRLGGTFQSRSAVSVMGGLGVGKRFKLPNNDHLNVKLTADMMLGIIYMNIPLALSVNYEF
ncbi:MAG: hypothetical protein J6R27_05645 [Muribaculaceae bacterium]|nr:hypothetical protein [Muribaculaceae bacterium]